MIKKLELSSPTSCLNKAKADEPLFVLRAKDPFAAMTIRHWASMSEGSQNADRLEDAEKLATAMEEYRKMNFPVAAVA